MNPYRYVPLGDDVYVDQWGPPPPNRVKVLAAAISVVMLVIVVSSSYSVVIRARNKSHCFSCESNLRQIDFAFEQYIQDSDEHFPLAVGARQADHWRAYGWADAIQPYRQSDWVFHCPAVGHSAINNPMARNFTDYWYNRHCSGVEQRDFYSSTETILCGDGNDGTDQTDARYSLGGLPSNWRTDESKPPSRHFDGADYLFADGHVQWLRPSLITNAAESQHTFAVTRPPLGVKH
ncbi:MAG: hypothetical protein JO316_21630 [Abitibacteriaceae bacterium]|nr:hypothetical protein [Abditibacteriaceae bacterium]